MLKKIAILVIELYKINGAGGLLHIVLDDDNFDDGSIQWCLENLDKNATKAESSQKEIEICRELATLILKLETKKRYKIWDKVEKIQKSNKIL